MNISQYACVWLALCISFPRVVAGASRPAALTGSARAAYQICLHWNVPVDYDDLSTLSARGAAGTRDALATTQMILSALGFECTDEKDMTLAKWIQTSSPCVFLRDGSPMVLWREGDEYWCRDYPNAAQKMAEAEVHNLWHGRAIVVRASPKVDSGTSGMIPNAFVRDFGLIDEGEVYSCSYTLRNASSDTVIIQGFRTSCGCALLEGHTGPLPPGEKCDVTLKFHSSGKTGYQQYYCLIKSDRGGAVLKLSGYVRSEGGYYPRVLEFGDIARDESETTRTMGFLGKSTDALRPIVKVSVSSPFKYRIEEGTNEEWKVAEDRIVVTVDPSSLKPGPVSASLVVEYRHDDRCVTVTVPITGTVVDAKRRSLLFLAKPVGPGESMHQTFPLRGIKKGDVVELKDVSESGLAFSLMEGSTGDGCLVVEGTPVWSGERDVYVTFVNKMEERRVLYGIYVRVEVSDKGGRHHGSQ